MVAVIKIGHITLCQTHAITVLPYFTSIALNHQTNIIYMYLVYKCHAFEITEYQYGNLRCSPQRQRVTDPPSELSSWSSSSSSSSSSAVEWVSCCNDGGGWDTVVDREVDFLGGWVRTLRRAGAAIEQVHTHNGQCRVPTFNTLS